MTVFVVLPALNEEFGILETINLIKSHIPSSEILVVDNGSTDNVAPHTQKCRDSSREMMNVCSLSLSPDINM